MDNVGVDNQFRALPLPAALFPGLDALGYVQMTPVQATTLGTILAGHDVLAQARTGTGKTAAFGLGLLARLDASRIATQALVLCPTRELADQVSKELRALACGLPNVKLTTLCGGIPLRPQLASLKHAPHVIVGTPGRIEELLALDEQPLDLRNVRTLVLDEADRMLDMGFAPQVEAIMARLPAQRQNLLFSATLPEDVRRMAQRWMQAPQYLEVAAAEGDTATLEQRCYQVLDDQRAEALLSLLLVHKPGAALVFCNTRKRAQEIADVLLRRRFPAQALHGDLEQREREEVLVRFANLSRPLLVATDVAARGLDIKELPLVVGLDLAHDAETHLHRIGRTARAGQQGLALQLVDPQDALRLAGILGNGVLEASGGLRPLDLSPARAAQGKPSAMATVVIDAGRQDKLRPGDVVGALTGNGGLTATQIGKIDSFATRTYVAVERTQFRNAMERLAQGKIKGRSFRVRGLD